MFVEIYAQAMNFQAIKCDVNYAQKEEKKTLVSSFLF